MFSWQKHSTIYIHFNDGPVLEIKGDVKPHQVVMRINGVAIHETTLNGNEWTKAHRRYLSQWEISVYAPGHKRIFHHQFDMNGQIVRVNIDSRSLGDTLAWLPQIHAFALQNPNTRVFVCHFWPDLFDKMAYPELHYIDPETEIENCYASFDIGYYFERIEWFHPCDPRQQPLGKVAADILGIEYQERRPALNSTKAAEATGTIQNTRPTVCIATASTAACKHWQHEQGWQQVIDYLCNEGYRVMVIQQESCDLQNIDDQTGERPITDRVAQIAECEFFIGLGSGLSWLAWAMAKPVVLISGFSEAYSEFTLDCERVINTDACHGCWNDTSFAFDRDDWDWCPRHRDSKQQFECSHWITVEMVINAITRIRER